MDQEFCLAADIFMNQYNMKQVLNRFRQSRASAIEKEVRQLVTMDTLDPENPNELSREDCRSVMAYLMFLKEKWDGTIKAQGCCNGRIQRNYMTKEENSPPPPRSRA